MNIPNPLPALKAVAGLMFAFGVIGGIIGLIILAVYLGAYPFLYIIHSLP